MKRRTFKTVLLWKDVGNTSSGLPNYCCSVAFFVVHYKFFCIWSLMMCCLGGTVLVCMTN